MTVRYWAPKGHLGNSMYYRPQGTEDLIGCDLEIRLTGFGIRSVLSLHLSSALREL